MPREYSSSVLERRPEPLLSVALEAKPRASVMEIQPDVTFVPKDLSPKPTSCLYGSPNFTFDTHQLKTRRP